VKATSVFVETEDGGGAVPSPAPLGGSGRVGAVLRGLLDRGGWSWKQMRHQQQSPKLKIHSWSTRSVQAQHTSATAELDSRVHCRV
jgi:hypothetical protein